MLFQEQQSGFLIPDWDCVLSIVAECFELFGQFLFSVFRDSSGLTRKQASKRTLFENKMTKLQNEIVRNEMKDDWNYEKRSI
jgi:hypothetical protein